MEKVKTSECAIEMMEYYTKLEEQEETFVELNIEKKKGASKFIKMPIYRQSHGFTCGVACVQSALRYAGYDLDTREDRLIKRLGSTPKKGTNRLHIENFLNSVTYKGEKVFRDVKWESFGERQGNPKASAFNDLCDILIGNSPKPVICIIQAWKNSKKAYSESENNDGHYVIAIGVAITSDKKKCVIFMDPSTAGGYAYIEEDEFMMRWHDADGDKVLKYYGLVLDYKIDLKSEDAIFYKLG